MPAHGPDRGATVRLRPMRADEYEPAVALSKAGYARDLEELADHLPAAAAQKAQDDFEAVLPQGLDTPLHSLYVVEADGVLVGRLWLAERDLGGRHILYIYEIAIHPEHQGRGYGRGAMLWTEEEARRRGIGRIELNVFGRNDAARNLYRSLGYVENSVQMAKRLTEATQTRSRSP